MPKMAFCLDHPFHPNATRSKMSKSEFDSVAKNVSVELDGAIFTEHGKQDMVEFKSYDLYTLYSGKCKLIEVTKRIEPQFFLVFNVTKEPMTIYFLNDGKYS